MSRYWKSVVFCGLLFITLQLIGLQYPSAEHAMVRARWLIWGLGMGWRYWKLPTFRKSPSPTEPGPESVQPEKLNTADKSELLPTQLPKDDK